MVALCSCFEDDDCGRALSFYAWFSGPETQLAWFQKDAFGQFALSVLLFRKGNLIDAAAQGFPDAIGHLVFNKHLQEGSNLSSEALRKMCLEAAELGSAPCIAWMTNNVTVFQERIEWHVRWAVRKGSMDNCLLNACKEALDALMGNIASQRHLRFLYVCGRVDTRTYFKS